MKILFATDGSVNAESATEALLFRPWPYQTKVRVITVVDKTPGLVTKLFSALGEKAREIENAWVEDCRKVLDKTVERLKEKFGDENVEGALIEGSKRELIIKEAQTFLADLIVMGAHQSDEPDEFMLGTITDVVVTNAPCSVSVLRRIAPATAVKELDNNQPIEEDKYLIAVDGTPHSELMVKTVLSRPWPDNACFRIVSVVQPVDTSFLKRLPLVNARQMDDATKASLEAEKKEASALVSGLAARFKERFENARIMTDVLEGRPKEVILEIARDWPADHIMLGSRKIVGVANEVKLQAVSKAVLFQAPCSVEIVR